MRNEIPERESGGMKVARSSNTETLEFVRLSMLRADDSVAYTANIRAQLAPNGDDVPAVG